MNDPDPDGMTPLLIASSQDGSLECMKLLLNAGANIEAKCNMDKDCLFYAQGQKDKLDLLVAFKTQKTRPRGVTKLSQFCTVS